MPAHIISNIPALIFRHLPISTLVRVAKYYTSITSGPATITSQQLYFITGHYGSSTPLLLPHIHTSPVPGLQIADTLFHLVYISTHQRLGKAETEQDLARILPVAHLPT
jgi:hypothetical protein